MGVYCPWDSWSHGVLLCKRGFAHFLKSRFTYTSGDYLFNLCHCFGWKMQSCDWSMSFFLFEIFLLPDYYILGNVYWSISESTYMLIAFIFFVTLQLFPFLQITQGVLVPNLILLDLMATDGLLSHSCFVSWLRNAPWFAWD